MVEVNAKASLQHVLSSPEFVELFSCDDYIIDLKYAGTDNFMGEDLYHEFNRAFLHFHAAEKLKTAAKILKEYNPQYKFIVYDVLRPRSVQWKIWYKVKGTNDEHYFANPENGSNHNYGMAVDLSIINDKGEILDMGTGFDAFDVLSQPKFEEKFLAEKKLLPQHYENRLLLRNCMEKAGFRKINTEWWHFDALPKAEIRAHYKIVE